MYAMRTYFIGTSITMLYPVLVYRVSKINPMEIQQAIVNHKRD